MNTEKQIILIIIFTILLSSASSFAQYQSSPLIFNIDEPPLDGSFFVFDINGDNNFDYIFCSENRLYVYTHDGIKLWDTEISPIYTFGVNSGNIHGAADIDGDGDVEIIALVDTNKIYIFDAASGSVEDSIIISVGSNQIAANMVLVNQRYPEYPQDERRDIIIQTNGTYTDDNKYWKFINRSLIAINLETGEEIWRVNQDNNPYNDNDPNTNEWGGMGVYEGYFGQAHGGPICADIDLDGRDEVIGGNVIDYEDNKVTIIDPEYYVSWIRWVKAKKDYIDHIDAIAVGDFRSDLPGLEWVIVEEDNELGPVNNHSWHTIMFSKDSMIWSKETTLFPDGKEREPQNICVGNFDNDHGYCEVWNRSRFGNTQHPWLYDAFGIQIAHYEMISVLPAGFNPAGNGAGIEEIWTIDWMGGIKEYIAGKARHTDNGHACILDAVSGETIWSTQQEDPQIEVSMIYVADVCKDNREELILCDISEGGYRIKVFWNEADNPNSTPNKWNDPLYSRLKQSWNYYSPGSYTEGGFPSIFNLSVTEITPKSAKISWKTDELTDSEVLYGLTDSYESGTEKRTSFITNHTINLIDLKPNTKYHYKVKSRSKNEKLASTPDNSFTTDQSITLLSFEHGGNYYIDSLVSIRWTSLGTSKRVNIEISRDGGNSWNYLFMRELDNGHIDWKINEPPSLNCLLRISDRDGYPSDITENEFAILDSSKKLILDPRSQTLIKGEISPPITVLVQDSQGDSVELKYDFDLLLQTSSKTGEFSLDSLDWEPVNMAKIDSGNSTSIFYYKDFSTGYCTIEVSESPEVGWGNSAQADTILLKTEDNSPPELLHCYPLPGIEKIPVNSSIQFKIGDHTNGYGLNADSLKVFINNNPIYINGANQTSGVISFDNLGANFLFHYTPENNFIKDSLVTVKIKCFDTAIPENNGFDSTYSFTAGSYHLSDLFLKKITPDGGSLMKGNNHMDVNLPAGSVSDTLIVEAARIDSIPELPDTLLTVGQKFYLGPAGLIFNNSVTVYLPYKQSTLDSAEVTEPNALPVFLFNLRENCWQKLQVTGSNSTKITVITKNTGYLIFCKEFSTGVSELTPDESSTKKFKLMPNYPNPFNPETSFKYFLSEDSYVHIRIYDLLGRMIKELVTEHQNSGLHSATWNGTDFSSRNVPSGIYLLHMEAGKFSDMQKMILRR